MYISKMTQNAFVVDRKIVEEEKNLTCFFLFFSKIIYPAIRY